MGSDIFLSYSRADQQFAEQFVEIASARGLTVWYDRMIEGGQDWRGKIVDELGTSKALVILFSEHSNASNQLIKELAIADNLRKLVVPVLIAKCEPRGAYLYELASRNWVNLQPNPETQIASLVDNLMKELNPRDGGSRPSSVSAAQAPMPQPPAAAQARTLAAAPVASPAPAALAQDRDESWFPLRRYDLYFLAPILVGGFWIGIVSEGQDKSLGLALSAIAFFCYMLVIAVRNARLNRSVFSGKSFASYFAVLAIGSTPVLVSEGTTANNVSSFFGLLLFSLPLAVVANVLQVVLRKIFQRNIFRSKIE